MAALKTPTWEEATKQGHCYGCNYGFCGAHALLSIKESCAIFNPDNGKRVIFHDSKCAASFLRRKAKELTK